MSNQSHTPANVTEAANLVKTHADRIALINTLLHEFSPLCRVSTMRILHEQDLTPFRTFEVVMHRNGINGDSRNPASSEENIQETYTVHVNQAEFSDDLEAQEEALNQAWSLFSEDLKSHETRTDEGWTYQVESGLMREFKPYKLEMTGWEYPAKEIQIREAYQPA